MTRRRPRARDWARDRGWDPAWGLLAAWAAACLAPSALAAQDVGVATVHSVSLTADLAAAPGVASVRVEYRLNGVGPGDSVPVSVLDFGLAVAQGFRVGAGGVPMALPTRHGAARTGSWPVEAASDGGAVLSVTYEVAGAGADEAGRIVSHLPVLIVDRAPEEARPGLFHGSVQVPADWNVTEGFPTGLAPGGQASRYDVDLSVVPAVVTLRARSDGRRGLALPLVLDLVAVSVLLITGVAGWRHMREPAL